MACCVVIGGIVAFTRWWYHRGEKDTAIVEALKANTAASAENTKSNQELSSELKDFKAETVATLRDHSWRLKILEDWRQEKD